MVSQVETNGVHADEETPEEKRIEVTRRAESSVVASVIRWNEVMADVIQVVSVEDFWTPACRFIFDAQASLFERGVRIDLVSVANELKRANKIEEVGGYGQIAKLLDSEPTGAQALHYAMIVKEASLMRQLLHAGSEIIRDAQNPTGPAEEILEAAEKRIFSIAEVGSSSSAVHVSVAVKEAFDRYDARTTKKTDREFPETGFIDLDRILGGLNPSELIVVAARPSVGKTAFGLALAKSAAVNQGMATFFVSLEQSRGELTDRMICSMMEIDGQRLRLGMLSQEECGRFIDGGNVLSEAPLHIDDRCQQKMLRIMANARRLKRKHGIKLVIVDYLQLIDPDSRKEPRHEQVANVSRRLKFLARELAVPVVAMAQLNRGVENRQGERPRLSDLRESGSIEQDADTVLLLHKPEGIDRAIEVIVAKQRNGPVGSVTLGFNKPFTRFTNFAIE